MNDANRKSLMLEPEVYDEISNLAKKTGVARPVVISAMMELFDEDALVGKIREIRAREKALKLDFDRKKKALIQLAGKLDLAEIERLLSKGA